MEKEEKGKGRRTQPCNRYVSHCAAPELITAEPRWRRRSRREGRREWRENCLGLLRALISKHPTYYGKQMTPSLPRVGGHWPSLRPPPRPCARDRGNLRSRLGHILTSPCAHH